MDEGDTVTLTVTAHGKTAGLVRVIAPATGGAGYSVSGESRADVHIESQVGNSGNIEFGVGAGSTTDSLDLAITADNRAEGDESFTVNLSAAAATITPLSATPASWTVGTPSSVTFTIRRNDANNRYDPPPVVTPAPTTDNPAARSARVEVPAAAIARGLGQLAADAVRRRTGGLRDADGRIGLWTGGGAISTDGERDGVEYDGDTNAWHIGVDRRWRGGLLGLSVGLGGGDLDFGAADNLDAEVTGVHPYWAREFGNKRVWLTAGYGGGDAELTEGDRAAIKTDISVTTAAAGLAIAPRAGVELSAGVTHTRAKLDAASAGGRALPATTADATRVAAAAELSREFAGGARPFLTVNVRHDDGDDEQGTAGDLGGGVEWQTPAVHFRLQGATHIGGNGGEETRFGLTLRRSFGAVALGLNLALDSAGLDTGRLLHGEWRF